MNERVIEIPWALRQIPQQGVVLDVGSCETQYLDVLASHGRVLHCLDVRDCQNEIPANAIMHVESIFGCTLPARNFDAVLLLSTVEHMGLAWYGQKSVMNGDYLAIHECRRLLKANGRLVVTVPAGAGKITPWYRQYSPSALRRLFIGWNVTIQYWGYSPENGYAEIDETEVSRFDYIDDFWDAQHSKRAGAVAGIVAQLAEH